MARNDRNVEIWFSRTSMSAADWSCCFSNWVAWCFVVGPPLPPPGENKTLSRLFKITKYTRGKGFRGGGG